MRAARRSACDPRCRPIFTHRRKPIPFAKARCSTRPGRGRYRNLGPRTARRDKRAPCRATYSEMQSIFAPSTAAGVGGVSRNARKRQGSKHSHLAWNRARLEHCIDGGGRPRILDQSRRLSKFGGRVVLRGQRLRISRSDRGYREGLGHRRQGIRPVRRGHAKSGRKDLDLPPARSHTPLCIRTATRLVARRRCGKIRQISARFHKSTVAGRHFEKSLAGNAACRRILAGRTRAIRSAQTCRRPAGWRHHVVSSATAHLGNSRVTIRGASCSGGAAPQQT